MTSKTTGKEFLVEALGRAGIDRIFGNPGSTELPLMEALAGRERLQYVLCLHDAVAVGAAHGFAMVTGRPAAVNLHAAPGLFNALAALYNAHKSEVPLLLTAGQVHTRLVMHEAPLWGDLVTLTRPLTKWAYEVKRPEELPWALHRALQVAVTPPSGPVFLSLPMNVLDERIPEEELSTPMPAGVRLGKADPEAVRRAVELLAVARRPLIVSGEAVATGGAVREVVELAELVGARVYGERMPPRVTFPEKHPLFCGSAGFSGKDLARNLAQGDVLLVVGTARLVPITTPQGLHLSDGTRVVQLEADPSQLGKVFPAEVGLLGDIRETVRELCALLRASVSPAEAAGRAEAIGAETRGMRACVEEERRASWDRVPVSVERLTAEIRAVFPAETVVVNEGSASGRVMRRHYGFERPDAYYGVKGAALGWGLPAAVGAAMALPGRQLLAFLGDGATLFAPQALWTAAHYGVAVRVIVSNNRGYDILKDGMRSYLGERQASHLGMDILEPEIDYAGLAESLGVPGRRVLEPAQLRETLEWARDLPGPALVEVGTG